LPKILIQHRAFDQGNIPSNEEWSEFIANMVDPASLDKIFKTNPKKGCAFCDERWPLSKASMRLHYRLMHNIVVIEIVA
jgi:hypothetical protein